MSKKTKKTVYYVIAGVIVLLVLGKFVLSSGSFFSFFFQLFFTKNIELKHEDDKLNILLMGIGGANHEGSDLTDTIIFTSLNTKTNKITMVSIPRDLWITDTKSKINAVYEDGEDKKQGGGLIEAKAIVQKITGQHIDYGVVIDFDGFVKAVDLVGGIDVSVENAFDDYAYPISGKEEDPCGFTEEEIASLSAQIATSSATESEAFPCRFEHIHFDKGIQHMDGETALEFVRSRHALGQEGSDFARSARQQNVIQAFKDKIFSLQVLANPTKVIDLYNIVRASIHTDIQENEFDDFVRLLNKMDAAKIESGVLDDGDKLQNREGLLVNPPIEDYAGAWVLIPRVGESDYSEIKAYVNCELTKGACVVTKEASN